MAMNNGNWSVSRSLLLGVSSVVSMGSAQALAGNASVTEYVVSQGFVLDAGNGSILDGLTGTLSLQIDTDAPNMNDDTFGEFWASSASLSIGTGSDQITASHSSALLELRNNQSDGLSLIAPDLAGNPWDQYSATGLLVDVNIDIVIFDFISFDSSMFDQVDLGSYLMSAAKGDFDLSTGSLSVDGGIVFAQPVGDLSVTVVPGPSTVGGLSFAGLIVARRRR